MELVESLLSGEHRALARIISKIEDRDPGYRDLVAELHEHAGDADVIGITGSPGAGKSTLVDKLAAEYRDRGETVGVIAIDPSSPFSGGAVLGDRIRMGSTVGDMDVFVRSMSTRGSLGGLSTATRDAVRALDAFGKDKIIIETVGAGQSEIDVVRAADTVAVLVPPGSGDDIQMLKAGILEIADVFVVNKADREGADRTVQQLREMLQEAPTNTGHHGPDTLVADDAHDADNADDADDQAEWQPLIVETVANRGEGITDVIDAFEDHAEYLDVSGRRAALDRNRTAEEIRTLLREDVHDLVEAEIERQGGLDVFIDGIVARETDPYSAAEEILAPLRRAVREQSGDE
jgi:LAO/AO transport system kinase